MTLQLIWFMQKFDLCLKGIFNFSFSGKSAAWVTIAGFSVEIVEFDTEICVWISYYLYREIQFFFDQFLYFTGGE